MNCIKGVYKGKVKIMTLLKLHILHELASNLTKEILVIFFPSF